MKDSFEFFFDEIEKQYFAMLEQNNENKSSTIHQSKKPYRSKNLKSKKNGIFSKEIIKKYVIEDILELRKQNQINIYGENEAKDIIIKEFTDINLSLRIFNQLQKCHISAPTPIQMQLIPYFLSGYSIFGQSPTGTGKTLCFVLPLVIMKMKKKNNFNGAIILLPTRELCLQVKTYFEQFVNVLCVYGGTINNFYKFKNMENQIIVATPGRLLQILRKRNFIRYFSHLVLDEIDKMMSPEFISKILQIKEKIHEPKCCVLAATCFDIYLIEKHFKIDFKVYIGDANAVKDNITQEIVYCEDKFDFLLKKVQRNTLIFVRSRDQADELTVKLKKYFNQVQQETNQLITVDNLHSGKDQIDRNKLIADFHTNKLDILICTDLMSRGIDFKVKFVLNFECPSCIDDYIHRIGRTGRIINGKVQHGIALTLCDSNDHSHIKKLLKFWEENNAKIDSFIYEKK